MNRWLQKKLYACPKCGASYVHDKAYRHSLFECPKRATAKR
jgi:transcription initiation factor IIE alpha subunit